MPWNIIYWLESRTKEQGDVGNFQGIVAAGLTQYRAYSTDEVNNSTLTKLL